tara:strand:+ start:820 stop:1974 length:1155 start_codon:yes stop_codon:yes gene_type:complete
MIEKGSSMKYRNSLILFIVYIISLLVIIYFDPLNIVTNYLQLFIFFTIFLGFLNLLHYYFSVNRDSDSDSDVNKLLDYGRVFLFIFLILGFMFLIYIGLYLFLFLNFSMTIVTSFLNIVFIILTLAIFYQLFSKIIDPDTNTGLIFELLKNLIFYIPCLFIDLIEFLKHQFKITSKTVWIILAIQIIVIILRFLIPYLYSLYRKYNIFDNRLILQEEPIYLNKETNVGIFQEEEKKKNKNFNYRFAVSCKIWINPQPPSTSNAYSKQTILLNCGDVIEIVYYKNKIQVYVATTNGEILEPNKLVKIYETKEFLFQRWNTFVVNYFGGTFDLFLNNKLIVSRINITPIFFLNSIKCGSQNGIHGGIKELIYYNDVLTHSDIKSIK